jgi:8-oxo-dGTP diphosphatase
MIREFSAGGLVIRNMRGRPHLAVVRVRDDILALPKGHPEKGESSQDATLREVREETGLDCLLGAPLGATAHTHGGREKEVRWFRMEPKNDTGSRDGEVDELRWLKPEEALGLLTYDGERELLGRL